MAPEGHSCCNEEILADLGQDVKGFLVEIQKKSVAEGKAGETAGSREARR